MLMRLLGEFVRSQVVPFAMRRGGGIVGMCGKIVEFRCSVV